MESLRKNKQDLLGIKNTVTERKTAFDGLISRLDTAEKVTSVLEDVENWAVDRNFQKGKNKKA